LHCSSPNLRKRCRRARVRRTILSESEIPNLHSIDMPGTRGKASAASPMRHLMVLWNHHHPSREHCHAATHAGRCEDERLLAKSS
jgi:hypothetical protein